MHVTFLFTFDRFSCIIADVLPRSVGSLFYGPSEVPDGAYADAEEAATGKMESAGRI